MYALEAMALSKQKELQEKALEKLTNLVKNDPKDIQALLVMVMIMIVKMTLIIIFITIMIQGYDYF